MKNFMSWLSKNDRTAYNSLSRYSIASSGFDRAWKELAKNQSFANAQHNFIKATHYDPVINNAKKQLGLNLSSYPKAVQDVLWSVGVQHGSGGAINILRAAGIKNGMSASTVINRIYDERSKVNKYFSRSSASIKQSVANRFVRERKDALAML